MSFDLYYITPFNTHRKTYVRGKTTKWIDPDTRELFNQNFTSSPNHPDLIYYNQHPITYDINSLSYRGKEPRKDIPVNVYLGGSITLGVGTYEEYTWPHLHSNFIGHTNYINAGRPAGGAESGYIRLNYLLEHFTISNVFAYFPFPHRILLPFSTQGVSVDMSIVSHLKKDPEFAKTTMAKNIVKDKYWLDYNYKKTIDAIGYLCLKNNIDFYLLDDYQEVEDTVVEDSKTISFSVRKARDLLHPPMKLQNKIAFNLYEKYLNKYTY